jgi:hypothetical protein
VFSGQEFGYDHPKLGGKGEVLLSSSHQLPSLLPHFTSFTRHTCEVVAPEIVGMLRATAEFVVGPASDISLNDFPSSSCFQLHPRFLSSLFKDGIPGIGVARKSRWPML